MPLQRLVKPVGKFPTMKATDSVMDGINSMISQESGVVMITDDDSHLEGIFSERDVMLKITSKGLDATSTLLSDVMTTEIIKVLDTVDAHEAIQIMVDGRIRHLPVVTNENTLVGLISLRYLLHDRIKDLLEECNSLEAYLNDSHGG